MVLVWQIYSAGPRRVNRPAAAVEVRNARVSSRTSVGGQRSPGHAIGNNCTRIHPLQAPTCGLAEKTFDLAYFFLLSFPVFPLTRSEGASAAATLEKITQIFAALYAHAWAADN